jgi:cell shape-determining protein MreC
MISRSHNRSRRNQKIIRFISAGVLIAGLWFLPHVATFLGGVVLYPVHHTLTWWRTSTAFVPTLFRDRAALETEIATLTQAVAMASHSELTLQNLIAENQQLRSLLNSTSTDRIAAGVLARPPTLPYDFIQIDRGSAAGIQVGAPVFSDAHTVIGYVTFAAHDYALVELFTSPGFEVTAFVQGPNVVAVLEGLGGGVARVRLPQGIALEDGNIVRLLGLESALFGDVIKVENAATQPEQFGYVAPRIPLQSLFMIAVGGEVIRAPDRTAIAESMRTLIQSQLRITDIEAPTSTATTSFETATTVTAIPAEL